MPNFNVIFHLLDGQIVKTIVNTCGQSGTYENLLVVCYLAQRTLSVKRLKCAPLNLGG